MPNLRPASRRAGERRLRAAPSDLQRSKSEATRGRILDAAVEVIVEDGFRGATSKRLAAASGMSWGAIQYQFGSKARIFEALFARTLSEFSPGLLDCRELTPSSSTAQRIDVLVEGVRRLIERPIYIAFRQILHDTQMLEELGLEAADLMGRIHRSFGAEISRVMAVENLTQRQIDLFEAVLFATLRGIEEQARLSAFPKWITQKQLELLKTQLCALVDRDFSTN